MMRWIVHAGIVVSVLLAATASAQASTSDAQAPGPESAYEASLHLHLPIGAHVAIRELSMTPEEPDPQHTHAAGPAGLTSPLNCPALGVYPAGWGSFTYYGLFNIGRASLHDDEQPRRSSIWDPAFWSLHDELRFAPDGQPHLKIPLTTWPPLSWPEMTGDPLPAPEVTVQARLLDAAAEPWVDREEWLNEGSLVLSGQTPPATLHPLLADQYPHVEHHDANGTTVYLLTVPLDVVETHVPPGQRLTLRMDVFIHNPVCGEPDEAGEHGPMTRQLRLYTGPGLRPALLLDVEQTITIHAVAPWLEGDDLWVAAAWSSPWGGRYLEADPVEVRSEERQWRQDAEGADLWRHIVDYGSWERDDLPDGWEARLPVDDEDLWRLGVAFYRVPDWALEASGGWHDVHMVLRDRATGAEATATASVHPDGSAHVFNGTGTEHRPVAQERGASAAPWQALALALAGALLVAWKRRREGSR